MPAFEESHIRQILQSINIVDFISSYVSLKPQGKDLVGLCPFHNDHKPSMSVSPAKQIFKCFSCGAGGDVFKFIMLRERMTFPEAVKLLAERAGIQLPQQRTAPAAGGGDRNELEKVNRWAAQLFRKLYLDPEAGKRAREYTAKRGIDEPTSQSFGLGWAPAAWDQLLQAAKKDSIRLDMLVQLGLLVQKETGGHYDRFRERLIFPVLDSLGRIIAFGGRTLGDDPAKYLNSPESPLFDKSRSLYGIYAAKDDIVKQKSVIVVEGYTDCMMAHQMGITNVVATLGTALTDEHARILSRYSDRIILMFDADSAGFKAADRGIDIFFKQKMEVSIATLTEGRDPCDFLLEEGPQAFRDRVAAATDALDYKWKQMCDRLEAQDGIKDHVRAVEMFLELVAESTVSGGMDQISQGFLLNRVARLVNRPPQAVHQAVAQLQGRKRRPEPASGGALSGNGRASMVFDGRQIAWQQIIEVLLNQPELYVRFAALLPNPDGIEDPQLQQIARRIWSCCQRPEPASLSEILAGCESPALCACITGLADHGAQRQNFEKTLQGAVGYLQDLTRKDEMDQIRHLAVSSAAELGLEAQTAMLRELNDRLRDRHQPNRRF